ncbi:unnamed protein product, partial [marine sediment metagenome]
ALYLISAPAREMNVALVRELGENMKRMAEDAVLRSGDYPRQRGELTITVILSQLRDVPRVRGVYSKVTESAPLLKKRKQEAEERFKEMVRASDDIPSLL